MNRFMANAFKLIEQELSENPFKKSFQIRLPLTVYFFCHQPINTSLLLSNPSYKKLEILTKRWHFTCLQILNRKKPSEIFNGHI